MTTSTKTNQTAALLGKLDELRGEVAALRRRHGELAGEQSKLRHRRAQVVAELEDVRASSRIAGNDAAGVDAELVAELERLQSELGVDPVRVPPTRDNPHGAIVRQGTRGALPLALARLDGRISIAEQAVRDYVETHRR